MARQAQTWAKWQMWLNVIRGEIYDLHHQRAIWRGLVDRIEVLGVPDSEYFLDAFTRMYVSSQAMGVRRQADTERGSVSLARLLNGLIHDSRAVTRDRFVAEWEFDDIRTTTDRGRLEHRVLSTQAESAWATFTSANVRYHLDPGVPLADLARLSKTAADVVRFATKTIAHTDRRPSTEVPTFRQLDAAVGALGTIYSRYCLLLTGSAPSADDLAPTMQGDWLAPFRQPLA